MWTPALQYHAPAMRTSSSLPHYSSRGFLNTCNAFYGRSFPKRVSTPFTKFPQLFNGEQAASRTIPAALCPDAPFDQFHGPTSDKSKSSQYEENRGKETVSTTVQTLLKDLFFIPLVALAFGVFLALECPATAGIVKHGIPNTILGKTPVSEIVNSGWAGLVAGCLHTLTGLDHLAALAPLCMGRPKLESAIVGALWGCGHDAGQIIFGVIFLLLKGKLKIELFQVWASRVVGITLLAIGAVGLKEAQEVPVSVLAAESAVNPDAAQVVEGRKSTQRLRTFATGLVYGLQPDALIMVLPALALPSRLAGAAYLGMFLVGTIISMSSYTAFIGSCGEALQKRLPGITQRLSIGSSVIAIIFGIGILLSELFGINFF